MRFRSLLAVGFLSVMFGAACAAQSADDAEEGQGAFTGEAAGGRSVSGAVDANAGEAKVTISFKLSGTTVQAVRTKVGDRDLSLWKSLKRPGEIKLGKETVRPGGAGTALFDSLERNGNLVEGYMPFSEKALREYAGLTMKFSYTLTDSADGFTLEVKNAEPVATKLGGIQVIGKNQLAFTLKVTKAGKDVNVEIQESVAILRAKDKVGKLLGFAFSAADALQAQPAAPAAPPAAAEH